MAACDGATKNGWTSFDRLLHVYSLLLEKQTLTGLSGIALLLLVTKVCKLTSSIKIVSAGKLPHDQVLFRLVVNYDCCLPLRKQKDDLLSGFNMKNSRIP